MKKPVLKIQKYKILPASPKLSKASLEVLAKGAKPTEHLNTFKTPKKKINSK